LPRVDLLDSLAEKQADAFDTVNSSQLRRFFSEVKDLYRQFEALTAGRPESEHAEVYRSSVEPRFKMVRSKVAYATRAGGQSKLSEGFAHFLSEGVRKVGTHEHFRLFVQHFEAVVGFMYGKGKVSDRGRN
jgi:CRISPR type III-A-associated protein Csm2